MTNATLDGKVVLVTGVTGNVGWGVARLALREGAHVVVPVRRSTRTAQLDLRSNAALVVEIDDFSEPSLVGLRERALERFGGIDHVFAPLGAWWQKGASLAQPTEELRALLDVYVAAQHALVKVTAPALRSRGGSYTMVTGAAGEHVVDGAGLLVTAVSAQYALSRVLRAELARDAFRFNELRIACRIERAERPGVVPSIVAAEDFARVLLGDQRSSVLRYRAPPGQSMPQLTPMHDV